MSIRSTNSSSRRRDGSKLSPYVIGISFIAATGGFMFGYDLGVSGGVTVMEDFLCEFFPRVLRHKIKWEAASYGAHVRHRCDKINGTTVMDNLQRNNSDTREMRAAGGRGAGNHTGMNVYCKYDNQEVQLFTSSLYLTAMVVTFAAGVVTRRHGRRASMLLAGAFFGVGAAISAAAVDLGMLIFGRIMLGCGVGFGNQVVPLFLSEIAPAGSRGGLNNLFQLFTTIGVLTASIVNVGAEHIQSWGWRLSLALPVIPALVLMVGSLLIVDTPNSLVERGKYEQARQALIKLSAGSGLMCNDDHINGVIEDLKAASASLYPNVESGTAVAPQHKSCTNCSTITYFGSLLKRRNRPPLLISIFVQLFQQFTSIDAIVIYSPVLFNSLGGPFLGTQQASLYSAIIIGAMNILSTFVAIYFVDRVGRRVLLLEASVQMCIAQVLIGIVLAKSNVESRELPKLAAIVVLLFICVFVSAFSWSWGPLGWLISTEIFPLTTRSQGQSVSVFSNMLFTFLISQTTLTSICHLKHGLFFFYGACIFIMGVVTYFFLPETMGIDIELMPTIWVHHWFWKRYFLPSPHDQPCQNSLKIHEISLNEMTCHQPNTYAIYPTSCLASPD